ncbi:TPA: hypothetical protein DCE37_15180 [Candidatus Latescibacteria bacterium]|nr:hypothetical protein [Candidatus Latescibacterota bacterium]
MSEYIVNDQEADRELTRLRLLEVAFDGATTECLNAIGVDPGASCLEVAAGAGSIARWMVERIGVDGRVTAVDPKTLYLAHGSSFYHSAEVRSGTLDELLETDVLVMCAGRGGRPEESRLDLLRDNARIAFGIAETFKDYKGSSLS